MIQLQEKHYINKGAFQKCYEHPEDINLCVKVKIDVNHHDDRVNRELRYYKKIQKKKIAKQFWAKYHGTIETNLGLGYVYDLVRDVNSNEISKTVSDYLKMDKCPIPYNVLETEFQKLKQQMIKSKIIVRDLTGKNVCCKILKDNSIELVIIDGVGHRDFIPLVDYFHLFTKRKVNSIYIKKQLHSMTEHLKLLRKLN